MAKPRKESFRVAESMVDGMATWKFILCTLALCVLEILGNKVGWFHFDPTMLTLNTVLSLWAAVQGSVIMISQKYQDRKRDEILSRIDKFEKKHEKDLSSLKHDMTLVKELLRGDKHV